ncbi:transposase [Hydrogenophaga sp.]|uniref:transposase n=1 Tax=Hydrogenophaga sp. TaxID=1904254 RepID=UPI003419C9C4
MKTSRFVENQNAHPLRLADSGTPVFDTSRQIGVSEAAYCAWKKRLGCRRLRA